eukprot:TRINITY_DN6477_c0_g1_i1.p1 TRINITY_DN6477_c0_g1~~TRINITY_DN6477_c0_g1_i1.p1  ORF type:complete len:135 (-),score=32.33 TRINITY_DN6477_c0_g1_i1:553-933(-)
MPPKAVALQGPATLVGAGSGHSCALVAASGLRGEAVWCWGNNDSGQLGVGSIVATRAPTVAANLTGHGVWQLVLGGSTTAVVDTAGQVLLWGENGFEISRFTGVATRGSWEWAASWRHERQQWQRI